MDGLSSAEHSKATPGYSWLLPHPHASPGFCLSALLSPSLSLLWLGCQERHSQRVKTSHSPQWFVLLCYLSPGQILIFHMEVQEHTTQAAAPASLPMEWLRQVGAHPSLKEHQPRESKIPGVKPQSLRNQWKFSQRFQQSNHSYFTLFSVTNANILPVYQGCLLGAASPRAPSVLPCH